jgi:hypothetical protein
MQRLTVDSASAGMDSAQREEPPERRPQPGLAAPRPLRVFIGYYIGDLASRCRLEYVLLERFRKMGLPASARGSTTMRAAAVHSRVKARLTANAGAPVQLPAIHTQRNRGSPMQRRISNIQ